MIRIIIGFSLLLLNNYLIGQTKEEILSFTHTIDTVESWSKYRASDNEIDFVFSSLFVFYKNHISSQDASRCGFHPSCSVYALEAIQKQGLIIGVINFFDRFSRCNGLSPEQYSVYDHTGLRSDPVKDIHYHAK